MTMAEDATERMRRYKRAGVWVKFVNLKKQYMESGGGGYDRAVREVDAALGSGEALPDIVPLAEPVVEAPITLSGELKVIEPLGPKTPRGLFMSTDFDPAKRMPPDKELGWVADHICVMDVDRKDAPSPMAYAYLMAIRSNESIKQDFFRAVWPLVIKAALARVSELGGEQKATDDAKLETDIADISAQLTRAV